MTFVPSFMRIHQLISTLVGEEKNTKECDATSAWRNEVERETIL